MTFVVIHTYYEYYPSFPSPLPLPPIPAPPPPSSLPLSPPPPCRMIICHTLSQHTTCKEHTLFCMSIVFLTIYTYSTSLHVCTVPGRHCTPRSRQSARLFLQSSELGPPHPQASVPPFGSGGGDTLACVRGGCGVLIQTGGTHYAIAWYSN